MSDDKYHIISLLVFVCFVCLLFFWSDDSKSIVQLTYGNPVADKPYPSNNFSDQKTTNKNKTKQNK
jgi:hypothetical protein